MHLVDINTLFSTEDKCRELLVRLRWPEGPRCLRCKMPVVELETEKQLFYCKDCDYQFSVTSGTVFNDSHLPLTKWFLTTHLLCEAKKGKGRIYRVDNKEVVVGIRKRNGDLRFFHSRDAKGGTLAQYIRENISEDVEVIFTDDHSANEAAMRKANRTNHKKINHSSGVYVMGDIHTNTVESAFSLLKRGIMGTWHRISAKHLPAYLEEMEFRFNRRKRSDLFVDTLHHMVTASTLTFQKLTA